MEPAERIWRARLAAHISWANTADPADRTAKAREAFNARFEKQVREEHPDWSEEQVQRAAEHLRQAHFLRMARASAKARRRQH